jgi:hypothetical protein
MTRQFIIALAVTLILISGCGSRGHEKNVVAKVNNYEITRDRFEAEFRDSVFGKNDTLESRKEFLANLIDRKLILQEAQAMGLDREPGFLRMIEKFWEQSLLKLALDKKTREIADAEARDTGMGTLQGSRAMDAWIELLRKKAKIEVSDQLQR